MTNSLSPENIINEIKTKLDFWQTKLSNRTNDLTYYNLCEYLLVSLLNPIYNWNLVNANDERLNFPGIDLVDWDKKISVQVTADTSLQKIKDTIYKCSKYHGNRINTLYVFILQKTQQTYSQQAVDSFIANINSQYTFDVKENVMSVESISKKIITLTSQPEILQKVLMHLNNIVPELIMSGDSNEKYVFVDQIIDKIYIDNKQLKGEINEELFNKYSKLFSHIISFSPEIIFSSKENEELSIFELIAFQILNSNSRTPLVISSFQGNGKSKFLILLYKKLLRLSLAEQRSTLPIYIDIRKHMSDATRDNVLNNINITISEIIHHLNVYKFEDIILILDGADDSFTINILKDDIYKIIEDKIENVRKIIGYSVSDHLISKSNLEIDNIKPEAEIEAKLNDLSVNSTNYNEFVAQYTDVELYLNKKDNAYDISKKLLEKIKSFGLQRIDFFVIDILLKGKYNISDTFSQFLSRHCTIHLNKTNLKFSEVSKIAYDYFVKQKNVNISDPQVVKLIFQHLSIRDYLIAFHISSILISKKVNNEDVNFVFTNNINSYCKEIMNSSLPNQLSVFESISTNFYSVGTIGKANFCYLLGRFKDDGIKQKAMNFLFSVLDNEDEKIQASYCIDTKPNDYNDHKEFLLYYRSIYISLINLKYVRGFIDENIADKYINILMKNKLWDSVNRGFHREYYGDSPFNPAIGPLQKEDIVEQDFQYTYTKLVNKIEDELNKDREEAYPLFEVDIYTLCSLAQNRQVEKNGLLTDDKRNGIIKLSEHILSTNLIRNNRLRDYVVFISGVLRKGSKISLGLFLRELFYIKEYARTGWVRRKIPNPESVAAHIYGAWLIGKICLPEISEEGDGEYDKNKILEIVLIHDIGEAYITDVPFPEKKQYDRENEEIAVKNISFLSTYFHNESDRIIDLFQEFEAAKNYQGSINGRIAKDLDKLDNLLQLYIYHIENKNLIDDFKKWEHELREQIKTGEGRKIRDYIVSHYKNRL